MKTKSKKIYDPRNNKMDSYDNPALILGDLITDGNIIVPWVADVCFWKYIASMADYCDEILEKSKIDEYYINFLRDSMLCAYGRDGRLYKNIVNENMKVSDMYMTIIEMYENKLKDIIIRE